MNFKSHFAFCGIPNQHGDPNSYIKCYHILVRRKTILVNSLHFFGQIFIMYYYLLSTLLGLRDSMVMNIDSFWRWPARIVSVYK